MLRIDASRTASTPLQRAAVIVALAGLVLASLALGRTLSDDGGSAGPVIQLGEMFIEGDLEIDAGATITVVNVGAVPHNLTVEDGPATPDFNGGHAAALDLSSLEPGSYTVYCSIEGHRAAGMEATLVVG